MMQAWADNLDGLRNNANVTPTTLRKTRVCGMAKDLISPNADAITRLKDFASQLRELEQPTSPISIHLAQYFADAIEDFLSDETGTADTLEAALGLTGQTRKRGRPRKKSKEDTAITERYHFFEMERLETHS